jgi:hypothetical protein
VEIVKYREKKWLKDTPENTHFYVKNTHFLYQNHPFLYQKHLKNTIFHLKTPIFLSKSPQNPPKTHLKSLETAFRDMLQTSSESPENAIFCCPRPIVYLFLRDFS